MPYKKLNIKNGQILNQAHLAHFEQGIQENSTNIEEIQNKIKDIEDNRSVIPIIYPPQFCAVGDVAAYCMTVGEQWANVHLSLKPKQKITTPNNGEKLVMRSMQLFFRRQGDNIQTCSGSHISQTRAKIRMG